MKRLLVGVLLALVLAGGVAGLARATQNRPDVDVVGSSSEVRYRVHTKGYDPELAAVGLWAACQQVVDSYGSERLPIAFDDDGGFGVTVRPALGEHARKRLVGCIEDGTIDRVKGDVLSIIDA
jgi:hypothetical protein